MDQYIEIQTTLPSREDAERLARALLSRRLAACVQISGPQASLYWWSGATREDTEWLCTAKTRGELYSRVEAAILGLHPYETPQITAVDITRGSAAYLAWIEKETATGG